MKYVFVGFLTYEPVLEKHICSGNCFEFQCELIFYIFLSIRSLPPFARIAQDPSFWWRWPWQAAGGSPASAWLTLTTTTRILACLTFVPGVYPEYWGWKSLPGSYSTLHKKWPVCRGEADQKTIGECQPGGRHSVGAETSGGQVLRQPGEDSVSTHGRGVL